VRVPFPDSGIFSVMLRRRGPNISQAHRSVPRRVPVALPRHRKDRALSNPHRGGPGDRILGPGGWAAADPAVPHPPAGHAHAPRPGERGGTPPGDTRSPPTAAEFAASLSSTELGPAVGELTATYNAVRFGGRTGVAPGLSALLEQLERRP